MPTNSTPSLCLADTELVAQAQAGDRSAFGHIVERYQSLVCGIAFSATGNVARSEDLAQETFVTAWRRLVDLREPAKLRSWLCGIVRNTILADYRKQGRQPVFAAAPLDETNELVAAEPIPATQAITNEEMSLLWREVGRLPEAYREPLVLFYREQRSVAKVAQALEISEDAAMQRLSRGRKLLHERMLAFVEGALERTGPGASFALGVQAALPLAAAGVPSALTAGTTAKSGALGLLKWLAPPLAGVAAALAINIYSIRTAPGKAERKIAVRWSLALWVSIFVLAASLTAVDLLADRSHWALSKEAHWKFGIWTGYLFYLAAYLAGSLRLSVARARNEAAGGHVDAAPSAAHRLFLIGLSYLASSAWIVSVAWATGDHGTALGIAALTLAMALFTYIGTHGLSQARAGVRIGNLHFIHSLAILVIINVRLHHWVAPIFHVPVSSMNALLPMAWVHIASVLLIGWVALLLSLPYGNTSNPKGA